MPAQRVNLGLFKGTAGPPGEPAPSFARQSPVFEGGDLKWKTLLQLLWRCLECMGFLVWIFENCCWSKFVKVGGLSWVIPFSIRSPVQQLGSEVNFENLHQGEEDANVNFLLPICKELGNLLQRYIPYGCFNYIFNCIVYLFDLICLFNSLFI